MIRKTSLVLILIATVLVAFWFFQVPLTSFLSGISNRDDVLAAVEQAGWWGPVLLSVLLILQVFLAFIPGQALMIASGYLYGFLAGTLIVWASLVAASQIAFLLSRRYGRPFASRMVTPAVLEKMDYALDRGVIFYSMSLVLPIFPNDAMCYIAGLGTMSSARFLAANMIGRMIAALITCWVGAYGSRMTTQALLVIIFAGAIGAMCWFLIKNLAGRASKAAD